MIASKIYRYLFNRVGELWFCIFRHVAALVNDFSVNAGVKSSCVLSFRLSKEAAVRSLPNGDKIFSWALLESDGRIERFGFIHDKSWEIWLNQVLRFQHFQWRVPRDNLLPIFTDKIKRLGKATWSALFKRYKFHNLSFHDLYSVPDIYYITKFLGHIPESVIDIGGGWGRLGMAWFAVGAKAVGVTDSIEQPYVIQHQYLSSIPNADFYETLDKKNECKLDFNSTKGLVHFPLWDLPKIPNESIEAISTVQVLREITRDCLEFLFSEIKRILKKGGIWYIRDNNYKYDEACMHDVDITNRLQNIGFKLVYRPDLIQGVDIHGVPRIFQKT